MAHVHDVDEALDQLRADGERITTARRVVLEQLSAAEGQHLTAEALAELVQSDHPDIHLSTIYRTLDFLTGAGILVDVRIGRGPAAYHFAGDAHHHAVCEVCGQLIELGPEVLAPVTAQLEADHGFSAHPSHIVFRGLCRDCQST